MTRTAEQLLETMIDELRLLRAAYERQGGSRLASRADITRAAALLPALHAVFHDEPFTCRELAEHPHLRPLAAPLSVKALGRLFSRAEHLDIDGLRIERVGLEMKAVLWRISTCVSGVSNR